MRVARPFVAAFAAVCMLAAPSAAFARDIRVALDQAFPTGLAEAAEGVAIGNPSIVYVSVQNDRFPACHRPLLRPDQLGCRQAMAACFIMAAVVALDETDVVMVTCGTDTAQ
ncbi:MAG: hypothetical protein R3C16_03755 [Hyphomonadaceae bacterium]